MDIVLYVSLIGLAVIFIGLTTSAVLIRRLKRNSPARTKTIQRHDFSARPVRYITIEESDKNAKYLIDIYTAASNATSPRERD